MSTRARIGYKTRDNNNKYNGLVISTYVHMDGDQLLQPLNEVFFSKKKAFDVCFSGYISSLDLFINNGCVLSESEKENQAGSILFHEVSSFVDAEFEYADLEYTYLFDKHEGAYSWKQYKLERTSVQIPVLPVVPTRPPIFNKYAIKHIETLYPTFSSILF
tara:strand:- start:1650 stop:2132 length:483 start_codon:yes stop_codon:yes gene_type:complete